MDGKALAVLEYPAVAERLGRHAETEHGAALARGLLPSPDAVEVARRQALTSEAVGLLEEGVEPTLRGIRDLRDAAGHAARGGLLQPPLLRSLVTAVAAGLQARAHLESHADRAPLLAGLAAPVDPALRGLADAISTAVEDNGGDLRDTASPRLRRLRAELRDLRHRVGEELRRLARSADLRAHLQEDFVTQRGGRPVLAVRADSRGRVQGIVHDASASGQTVFVEPFAVVELNNRVSEAAAAEREEAERILRELAALVAAQAPAVRALVEATGAIDVALASATLSRAWRGAPVTVANEVRLIGARHPLLDAAAAVPIDLDLGALRALVVSGPNAGGKTVALKTIGLAAVLHQAGLRPPAASLTLPVFDHVLADIGDEQSIVMSLSTFSGHVRNLVAILESATARSLVLVDEVASGTDPVEGAALARALLARLARQARLTVVTTHYEELKEWASDADGVANAATGFDPETHAPLYRIAVGRPGTSHALQIAERLGLDSAVVADARSRVAPERLRIAGLLAEAEVAETAAAEARAAATREHDEAERAVRRAAERERELLEEIERVRASASREREAARAEAERELADARAELAALREEIRAAARREGERRRLAGDATPRAQRERDRRLGAASEHAQRAERALGALERPVAPAGPLAPGDPVEAPALGVRGTVVAVEGDEAEVVGRGGLRVRIALSRLRPDASGERAGAATPEPAVRVHAAARGDVADELDVRGRRAHEAREVVRSFVDDAALAGLPSVRVIHGRGTGAVRDAVRDELRRHQLVERHEPDAADGATVVHLAGPRS